MTDIERITRLALADQELDHLDKELAHLRARISSATVSRDEAKASLAAAQRQLTACKDAERATAREVEQYEKRRATATRALENGLGDPEAAERQVDQCTQIIDDLENRELEEMEAIEEALVALDAAEAVLAGAERFLESEQAAAPPEIEAQEAVRTTAQAERDAAWADVPRDLQRRYALVRKKKRFAAVELRDGYCVACRVKVPLQEVSDVNRGLLKHCFQCGRFLLPSKLVNPQ